MYILKCRDASFYVGSTWDLSQRVAQHEAGFGSEFDRIEDAFKMEKRVQGWSRAKWQALIDETSSHGHGASVV